MARIIAAAVEREWGEGLVTSWNRAGWFDLPTTMGDDIAGLIGAAPGEVVVTDSTGVNLFKALAVALDLRPDRRVVVMEGSNFPTDNYVVQGSWRRLGRGHQIRFAEKDDIEAAIDGDVAAVALTHVHYKSSHVLDMAGLTAAAHEAGALAIWDLCHSGRRGRGGSGRQAGADLAVGCTYKYLNGGPGSPAFLFLAARHQARARRDPSAAGGAMPRPSPSSATFGRPMASSAC